VKQAYASEGGRIRLRDAVGKFVIATLQIGSGGSLGREGPTVHICAGAASALARLVSLPPRYMRRLTPVGVAAGIAAAFNAPIAAVTFTIEEVVGTLDQTVLSGVVVAAALAAVIERGILGGHPVIEIAQPYGLSHASSLLLYALLGVAAAGVSLLFTEGLLKTRRWFGQLRRVPLWIRPGLGGLLTGGLAAAVFGWLGTTGVTGGGYATLGRALGGQLALRTLVALGVVKVVATISSYSSGGAGGIFAPSLFFGAMLGGAVGHLDVALFGHESSQLGAFALVGMGAVFAGVIRAPITSVLIIFEMTGGYGLVLPLMVASSTSYVIARRFRPTPIYEALLEQDGIHLPHGGQTSQAIDRLSVSDAMTSQVVSLGPDSTLAEAQRVAQSSDFALLPVLDAAGVPKGSVAIEDLLRSAGDAGLDALVRPVNVIRSDEPLVRALVHMNDAGIRQLVVIDPVSGHLAGMLTTTDVVRGHARALRATAGKRADGSLRPPPEISARHLMADVELIERSAKLPDLVERVETVGVRAFALRDREGRLSVVLPEHLEEIALDEELQRMLVAADVARPVGRLGAGAGLTELLDAIHVQRQDAVAVTDEEGELLGVVTRSTLAQAVLDWFTRVSVQAPA